MGETMDMTPVDLRVLIYLDTDYKDGTIFIAQGLEYDITAQAPKISELLDRFSEKLACEAMISQERGVSIFHGIPQAPPEFWESFDRSTISMYSDATPPPSDYIRPRVKFGELENVA